MWDLSRHDQEYHAKLEKLQAAIDESRGSGISDRTLDDIWADVKARHADAD